MKKIKAITKVIYVLSLRKTVQTKVYRAKTTRHTFRNIYLN